MLTRRRAVTGAATLVASPFVIGRAAQAQQTVKIGNILGGPTMAGYLLPKYLKDLHGITAEVINFPNITQRMQAIASGDVQIGYGGINAAISLAGRGVPLMVLSNATDGGWYLLGGPKVKTIADLKGKKCAVQPASISHICLLWKLQKEKLDKDVELLMMNNNDMPIAMQRGDIDALIVFEPYAAFTLVNNWASKLWEPYETPMGRTNLGVIATPDFVAKNGDLTKKILSAHKAATAELQKDNTAAADAIVKALNMPPEVAKTSLTNTFFTTESGPGFRKGIEALGSMMLEAKMTDKLPNWDTFINTTLL